MTLHEYHQARAENFAQNFHSLRQVEWQVAFQAYAGYAAIAVGFHTLLPASEGARPDTSISWASLVAALFVFLVTLYTALRILERMHKTRKLEMHHLDEMQKTLDPSNQTPPEGVGTPTNEWKFWLKTYDIPIHAKWYAFASQMAINVAWLAGIYGYVIYKTGLKPLLGC